MNTHDDESSEEANSRLDRAAEAWAVLAVEAEVERMKSACALEPLESVAQNRLHATLSVERSVEAEERRMLNKYDEARAADIAMGLLWEAAVVARRAAQAAAKSEMTAEAEIRLQIALTERNNVQAEWDLAISHSQEVWVGWQEARRRLAAVSVEVQKSRAGVWAETEASAKP